MVFRVLHHHQRTMRFKYSTNCAISSPGTRVLWMSVRVKNTWTVILLLYYYFEFDSYDKSLYSKNEL